MVPARGSYPATQLSSYKGFGGRTGASTPGRASPSRHAARASTAAAGRPNPASSSLPSVTTSGGLAPCSSSQRATWMSLAKCGWRPATCPLPRLPSGARPHRRGTPSVSCGAGRPGHRLSISGATNLRLPVTGGAGRLGCRRRVTHQYSRRGITAVTERGGSSRGLGHRDLACSPVRHRGQAGGRSRSCTPRMDRDFPRSASGAFQYARMEHPRTTTDSLRRLAIALHGRYSHPARLQQHPPDVHGDGRLAASSGPRLRPLVRRTLLRRRPGVPMPCSTACASGQVGVAPRRILHLTGLCLWLAGHPGAI